MSKVKKIVFLSLLTTQALILSLIEYRIPLPVNFPGVKPGYANIITLIAIVFFGLGSAILVVIARCTLASFFTGGIFVFMFSITGGILSTIIMGLLYKYMKKAFSIVGISIAGAIIHNMAQLIVAAMVMRDSAVFNYLPVLLLSAVITGGIVGLVAGYAIKIIKKNRIL